MIQRELKQHLLAQAAKFPVVALIGPRQSGKTTLARSAFPKLDYASLEDFDVRAYAEEDPRGFLLQYKKGCIIDEAQKVPLLFSYLQKIVDERVIKGPVILTGSQNFLLHEKISQSLAGRVSLFSLLPLSMKELKKTPDKITSFDDFIFSGGYPRLFDKDIKPTEWYPSYIQTYLERDVRSIKNILDLSLFQRFLALCAGRIGQLLNMSALATECGVSHTTISSWISLLESSFIVYLLKPHHVNLNKRVVKMPKLYFYDTGVACSILGIDTVQQLTQHYLYGSLFENAIINELTKNRFNQGKRSNLFFWRDQSGHEIDCIIEEAGKLNALEIKSSKTISPRFFDNLIYWEGLKKDKIKGKNSLIYGGDQKQVRHGVQIMSWSSA